MSNHTRRALLVDLGNGATKTRDLPDEWYDDFIGGEGLAIRLFCDYMAPEREPLDPGEPILFATGPLNATKAPACGRTVVVFRSSATGTLGITNVGGHFAPALRSCSTPRPSL